MKFAELHKVLADQILEVGYSNDDEEYVIDLTKRTPEEKVYADCYPESYFKELNTLEVEFVLAEDRGFGVFLKDTEFNHLELARFASVHKLALKKVI